MNVDKRNKEPVLTNVGDTGIGYSFLHEGKLCTFVLDDRNLIKYDNTSETPVFSIEDQRVYILPYNTKVVVVDVDPIVYTHK